MESKRLCSDRISNLPQHIKEDILSRMPIRDALRTSVLSKKWRLCWRGMPKLTFDNNLVETRDSDPSNCQQLTKYKLLNAVFHVLFLHNGSERLEFRCDAVDSELDTVIAFLSRGNNLKELTLNINTGFYKLPTSFFTWERSQVLVLGNCNLETPLTFKGFRMLRRLCLCKVKVSATSLQRFISNCPLLEAISLARYIPNFDFTGGKKFTFVELILCVPLIKGLYISGYYTMFLCAGGMPHKLPMSPVRLRFLHLDVCMTKQNEVSSALCMLRSYPLLVRLVFQMYEFVKLIMAKSPILKKLELELKDNVSGDEELKMLKDLVLLPFPRASPAARLIIKRSR